MIHLDPAWLVLIFCTLLGMVIQKQNVGSLFRIGVSNVFLYFFFVKIILGVAAVHSGFFNRAGTFGQTDPHIIHQVIYSVSLCTVLVPIGIAFGSLALSRPLSASSNKFYASKIEPFSELQGLMFFVLICLVVYLVYLRSLPSIPVFSVFSGLDFSELSELRSQATNSFAGNFHRYSIFFKDLLPFLSLSLFSYYLVKKQKPFLVFGILLITFFVLFSDLQKAPTLKFLIGLFFVFLLSKRRDLKVSWVVSFVGGLFALSIGIKAVFMALGDRPFMAIVEGTFQRIVGAQVIALYHFFEMFPSLYDFLGGKSLPNPGSIFPYTPVALSVLVHDRMWPELAQMNIVGSSPTVFYGSVYANFGMSAAIASMLALGFILGIIEGLYTNGIKKDALGIGLVVWMSMYISNLAGTGMELLLFNIRLYLVLFAYIAIRFIAGWRKNTPTSQKESV